MENDLSAENSFDWYIVCTSTVKPQRCLDSNANDDAPHLLQHQQRKQFYRSKKRTNIDYMHVKYFV
jgi:hypothetical protein